MEVPADGSQAPSGSLAGEAARLPEAPSGTSASEDFLAATTPEELGALRLGPLGNLARGLRSVGPWTSEGRIARAYRAGLFAGALFREEREWIHFFSWAGPSEQALHRAPVRLRCRLASTRRISPPSRPTCSEIGTGAWSITAFATGFPSRAEIEAYLCGADLPWPREL